MEKNECGNRSSLELRERAVRMVFEHQGEFDSQSAAIKSIAPKIGCEPDTLQAWVRRAGTDSGRRDGVATAEPDRINTLERKSRHLRQANVFLSVIAVCLLAAGCQMVRNSGDDMLPTPTPGALRIATYNVHYIITFKETGPWSVGDWERRKGPLDSAFKEIDADVIGFQEMESFGGSSGNDVNLVLDWLLDLNPIYAAAAVGDPQEFPSTQPILYRRDRLEMLDQGWFFFSERPDEIYSRTFNGSFPAFASWAMFRDRETNAAFRVINVHTDYASRNNRLRSVELVANRITPWAEAGETLFVVGDLNARLGEKTIRILQEAGVTFAPVKGATYHFNRGLNLFGAIDHIGSVGHVNLVGDPVVIRRRFNGEWPADHYPVIAEFELTHR